MYRVSRVFQNSNPVIETEEIRCLLRLPDLRWLDLNTRIVGAQNSLLPRLLRKISWEASSIPGDVSEQSRRFPTLVCNSFIGSGRVWEIEIFTVSVKHSKHWNSHWLERTIGHQTWLQNGIWCYRWEEAVKSSLDMELPVRSCLSMYEIEANFAFCYLHKGLTPVSDGLRPSERVSNGSICLSKSQRSLLSPWSILSAAADAAIQKQGTIGAPKYFASI